MEIKIKKLILLLPSVLAAFASFGQYDQNIAVEGRYLPEYVDHDRIGLFPKPLRLTIDNSSLEYSLTGVNANFRPQAVPLQATGWETLRRVSDSRGYIELGAGSWLQSTLSAGYRFIDSRSSAFGVRLQHNSTSLWKPVSDLDTRQWRYDESIGLYGHHNFENVGRLKAAADYHIGNFNYYGFQSAPGDAAPTQTLNDIALKVSWHSMRPDSKARWYVQAGARYFGYRSFYAPSLGSDFRHWAGGRETDINLSAGIDFQTASKSAVGIDLQGDYLLYAKPSTKADASPGVSLPDLDPYGLIRLTPYYRFETQGFFLRLGAEVDLAFDAGAADARYEAFHIAPSARLGYNAGAFAFYINAMGGSELHTLASGYQLDYYQMPVLTSTAPVYSPIDAKVGVTFGPFSGFHAGADIAFKRSKDLYFGGLYQLYLNNEMSLGGACYDQQGISVGVNVGYDAGRYFCLNAAGNYQPQKGKTGYFNGYDRPEWTSEISAETNPWSSLKFKLGYKLRAMRMVAVPASDYTEDSSRSAVDSFHIPNLSMLNFGVSYGITDSFNVWLQADNLLCRRQYYMPGLPEPGLRLSAGLGISF